MRRGCIAVGNIHCDGCGRTIKYPERYLVMDEEEGSEAEGRKQKTLRYCIDCCLDKGYAHYKKMEKGEEVLTFFTEK